MRAIFKSFDGFMAMFVAMFGVAWSTMFMPLLGGPLHTYEARAIGAGWQSLQTGQAANIGEAIEAATSLPVEAVFPSAHAEELPAQLAGVPLEPDPLELLGGPDAELPRPAIASVRRGTQHVAAARAPTAVIDVEATPEPICDAAAMKQSQCEAAEPSRSA